MSLSHLLLSFLVFLTVVRGGENYPKSISHVEVKCDDDASNLFECEIIWENSDIQKDEVKKHVEDFASELMKREEVEFLNVKTEQDFEGYKGSDYYKKVCKFLGFNETDETKGFPENNFMAMSYFLEYHANNTFTVSNLNGKSIVGFSGGIYSIEDGYDEKFMDALRDITVQYDIKFDSGDEKDNKGSNSDGDVKYYAIGYLGSFSVPYLYINAPNKTQFALAYNIDYGWATRDGGKLKDFYDFFNPATSGKTGKGDAEDHAYLPGMFMSEFAVKGISKGDFPDVNFDQFKKSFKDQYGLQNYNEAQPMSDNDRYIKVTDSNGVNYCRSLARDNKPDKIQKEQSDDYDFHEDEEEKLYICNKDHSPSYFFMTHTLNKEDRPFIFSTKYQTMIDGSCQYRTELDNKGKPKTSNTNVSYNQEYSDNIGKKDAPGDLEKKDVYVLDGSDFMAIHIVQDWNKNEGYKEGTNVPTSYGSYTLNTESEDYLYFDTSSFCNTGISDIYVLYDMKSYANVYSSILSITKDSFGVNSVYNSMKTYPTKYNYTAVITAADGDGEVKSEIQKCVNVFLDTGGKDIAQCNDVTESWNWGVFGGSIAGIVVVVGLWVWGGLYSKSFKTTNPPYYVDLLAYEAEWKRKDEEAQAERAKRKAAKRH